MQLNNYPKKILALLFICFMAVLLSYELYRSAGRLLKGTGQDLQEENPGGEEEKEEEKEEDKKASLDAAKADSALGEEAPPEEEELSPLEQAMLSFRDTVQSRLDMRGFYYELHMFITEDRYIVKAYPETTTDYEFDQVMLFKEFLDREGIHFAYVNQPTKYLDDTYMTRMFGVYTYTNANADRLVSRLRGAGVRTLDLREELVKDGLEITDLFYRTDHHWTTRAGLWASGKIARVLNDWCGYSIDLSLFDEDRYDFTTFENAWVGEQGKKIGASSAGTDDYTEICPKDRGQYTFYGKNGPWQEDFMGFINESAYDYDGPVEKRGSLHYSYNMFRAVNEKVEQGKVLIIGDSFSHVTEPFLSQAVHEIDAIVLRGKGDDFGLRQYILDGGYDTVLICYAQTNIGAHDDPKDANAKMFWLDR